MTEDFSKFFETRVQYFKFRVLEEVAAAAFADNLSQAAYDIPKKIIPGKKPTTRCCVYKERAILGERVKLAMGGNPDNPNVVEVIGIACDECKESGYHVTENCRGCLAHRCEAACPVNAITFDDQNKAVIDTSKCIKCGKCAAVCPYEAIISYSRPCEKACKVKAISQAPEGEALIDNDTCVACGACIYQCPFGAIMDKSYILEVVDMIKAARENSNSQLIAIIAPAIAAQFSEITVGQCAAAIKKLGFTKVCEAALGADMTAAREAHELMEKGTLTSSCCPAFVRFVKTKYPKMAPLVSETPSPMVMAAMSLKSVYPDAKIVFIGPCSAKKAEIRLDHVKPFIDSALSFEELFALLAAENISLREQPDEKLDDATRYGRNFAESGGVAAAIKKAIQEHGNEEFDMSFNLQPTTCSGLDECNVTMLKASMGRLEANFIEGMACSGGCINGALSLRRMSSQSKKLLEAHSSEVGGRKITEQAEKGFK